MTKPLVSIIIPVFNAEPFLDETLRSVLHQTYENWECILINDGSTDNSWSILEKWARNNPKIKIFSKENEGASKARNFGIRHAKGEYIAFLDSDDLWLPIHLSTLIKNLLENNTDLVFSYAYRLENKIYTTIPALDNAYKNIIWGLQEGKSALENFLQSNKISTPFCLVKRDFLIKNKCFDYQKNGEDYHAWLKLLLDGGKFFAIPKATGYVRIRENSTSDTDRNCTREVIEILTLLQKDIKKWGIDYPSYFSLWCRRFLLLKESKAHYIEALNYINSIEPRYFATLKNIAPLLPKKILKIICIFRLKIKFF